MAVSPSGVKMVNSFGPTLRTARRQLSYGPPMKSPEGHLPYDIPIFLPQLLSLDEIVRISRNFDHLDQFADPVAEGAGELVERVEEDTVREDAGGERGEVGEHCHGGRLGEDAVGCIVGDANEAEEEQSWGEDEDGQVSRAVLVVLAVDEVAQVRGYSNGGCDDGGRDRVGDLHDGSAFATD